MKSYFLIAEKLYIFTLSLHCSGLKGRDVYLVAATLRPETMYGQTNCWIHPDIPYVACAQASGEVFVSTRRAALNMSYQGFSKTDGKMDVLVELVGQVRALVTDRNTASNTYDFLHE